MTQPLSPNQLVVYRKIWTFLSKWPQEMNVEKTKIVVFRKGNKPPKHCTWTYNSKPIEVVKCFNYLGLSLFYNGKFVKVQSIISFQWRK